MLGILISGNGFTIDGPELYEVRMVTLALVIGVCVFLGISQSATDAWVVHIRNTYVDLEEAAATRDGAVICENLISSSC